ILGTVHQSREVNSLAVAVTLEVKSARREKIPWPPQVVQRQGKACPVRNAKRRRVVLAWEVVNADRAGGWIGSLVLANLGHFQIKGFAVGAPFHWRSHPAGNLSSLSNLNLAAPGQQFDVIRRKVSMLGGGEEGAAQKKSQPAQHDCKAVSPQR